MEEERWSPQGAPRRQRPQRPPPPGAGRGLRKDINAAAMLCCCPPWPPCRKPLTVLDLNGKLPAFFKRRVQPMQVCA